MTVTVVQPATHREMTTLIQLKAELGETGSSNDGLLTNYILAATDLIERWTGRKFAKETVTESFGSDGRLTMLLDRTPILSITNLAYDGSTSGYSSTEIDIIDAEAGIIYRDDGFTDTRKFVQGIVANPSGYSKQKWAVTYIGGFEMPGSTGATTFPADLEKACIDICKLMYHNKSNDPSVAIKRVGDASETRYIGLQKAELPPTTMGIISRWTRLDIP